MEDELNFKTPSHPRMPAPHLCHIDLDGGCLNMTGACLCDLMLPTVCPKVQKQQTLHVVANWLALLDFSLLLWAQLALGNDYKSCLHGLKETDTSVDLKESKS